MLSVALVSDVRFDLIDDHAGFVFPLDHVCNSDSRLCDVTHDRWPVLPAVFRREMRNQQGQPDYKCKDERRQIAALEAEIDCSLGPRSCGVITH